MQTAIGEIIGNQATGYLKFRARYKVRTVTGRFFNKICSVIDEKINPIKKHIPGWAVSGATFMAAQGVGRYTYKIAYSAIEKTAINRIKNNIIGSNIVPRGLCLLSSTVTTHPLGMLAGSAVLLIGGTAITYMIKHQTVANYFFPSL